MTQDSQTAPPRTDDWCLRPARPADVPRILEGFDRVYGRAPSAATWYWKLATRASAVDDAWIAVDRDGRPIFHYAGLPCRLRLPAGSFDARVAVDLWTVPEYRRQGIFTRCARWVHEQWRQAGVVGLFGAPGEQFGSRDHVLGWRRLFPLRWQIRPLRPEAIVARRLGLPGLARLRIAGRGWNGFWNLRARLAPGIEIRRVGLEELAGTAWPEAAGWGLERGADWIRWRYLTCPRHDYRVWVACRGERAAGYLVDRVEEQDGRRFAYVAELVAEDGDAAVLESLISAAVARLEADGAVAIATLAVPGTASCAAWRRRGFLFSWGSFGLQCLPLSDVMDPAELRDPRRWTVAGGDLDVI